MGILEAIILGIIQGLTEFLPVSSSGHIEIGKVLLNVQATDNLLFSIVVHGATALSTIIVFRKEIINLFIQLFSFQWNESTQYIAKLVLSMIPVGIAGILFEDQIEAMFEGNLILVGSALLFTALLLAFTYYKKSGEAHVTFKSAIIIGIAQAIAIIPGVSRSGSTIATALLLGVDKEKATRFSFLMVLLPIMGAMLLKVKDYMEVGSAEVSSSAFSLIVGFIAAFIFGLLACTWMIKIVKKGKLVYFAIYCFIIGIIAIVGSLL